MTKWGWILNAIMGLVLMGTGGTLLWQEIHTPPTHNGHVYTFVGIALLGALLINPTPIISSVKQIVVIVAPIIPWSKMAQQQRASGTVTPPPDDKG